MPNRQHEGIMPSTASRRALACALFATTALSQPAFAQFATIATPPVRQPVDENGVDIVRMNYSPSQNLVSIGGGGNQGLTYGVTVAGWTGTVYDSTAGTLNQSGTTVYATLGDTTDSYTVSGTTYTNSEGNGATLALVGGFYVYTNRNGVVARFLGNTINSN
jgi:hypothetical protein